MIEHSVYSRVAGRFPRYLVLLLAVLVATPVVVASAQPAAVQPAAVQPAAVQQAAAQQDTTLRVLLFYKTQFHASNVQARAAIRDLAAQLGEEYDLEVEITETDDASVFTPESLATYDTLAFAQTGGVLFDDAQRAALRGYIHNGGGWLGMHYAGWTGGTSEHDVNDWYLRLVGAVSEHHPENPPIRQATVRVSEPDHPLTQELPASFTRGDEWYDFHVNPAGFVRTLLEADESTYTDGRHGTKHPVTWCQEFEGGRSWYTSMGHEGSAYSEPVMRTQLRNGLAYTAGLLPADCSPPVKDEVGEWSSMTSPTSRVTPWPLLPINAALTHDGLVHSYGGTTTGCTDSTPYDWTGNSCQAQGGQFEIDIWDPTTSRTLDNVDDGVIPNTTYTDLFCSVQVHNPHTREMMTMGGDDGLGINNNPVNGPVGVTSYSTRNGLRDEAPMQYPRWYPSANVMPNGDIVVQGGSVRGVSGPGVLTPERYTPNEGSGWTALTGATSSAAYGGGGHNHWWYPRSWVAPGNGNLFNIAAQVSELDPAGTGTLTLRGTLPSEVADQGELGEPIGATSTAVMYEPGKILQVGGGAFSNGGGGDGARAGFTVDITGPDGTADPEYASTQPMRFGRHWANATVLPTGEVLVTGGGRTNNGAAGVATTPEIWNPDTGEWTSDLVPHAHARLYHSIAMLLPDGRVMIAGGGGPGPWNYTDAEFYSPPYLFDGNELAARPKIHDAPSNIGLRQSVFRIQVSEAIDRVALVRSGSVTHSFNNGQNFQDLEFRQTGSNVTVEAPDDGTYAPPGAYMLFVINEDGTPSEAAMLEIDPEVAMDSRSPQLVDQFEYPRVPHEWATANPPTTVTVEPGSRRMAPWTIDSPVQLIRGTAPTMGGLGAVGYHLELGASGSLERSIKDLVPGQEYRVSLRYARDSGVTAGPGDTVSADLSIGSLDTTITATSDEPSRHPSTPTEVTFGTYVGTFTATQRSETLTLAASGTSAGVVIDDLVIHATEDAPAPPDPQPSLPTTTTVSVDPPSPVPWGEPLTVTATVEGADGEPAEGSVELWIDGTQEAWGLPWTVGGDGSFTFSEISLDPGEHTVEVRFVGKTGWRDSQESVTSVHEPPPPLGEGVPTHYTFDEGQGTTAANTGSDVTIGNATLLGDVGWTPDGRFGSAVDLPGGAPDSNQYVSLPDNLTAREEYRDDEFSVSLWANPRALTNWVPLIQIGSGTNTFFLVQSNMQADGCSCFGVTLKAPDSGQERLLLGQGHDLPLNQWTHVVVTMSGSTGKIYLNGELQNTRTDFTVGIGDVGINGTTTANELGSTSWFDQKWNGRFDDVRIYAHELGEEEIRDLFEGDAGS